ncbi:MAG: carboxypeptidase regulatory-like domain-containing protein [Bryobacteraceae bacterium]
MKIRTMAATLAGLLLMALPSFAQITVIEGVVMGPEGAPLKGALIRIERTDVTSTFKVTTDKKGHYIYNGLPLGTFNVTCVVDGKDVDKVAGVRTTTQKYTTVDFNLKAKAAMQQAAAAGNLSKDQERGMSAEDKQKLEELYKKRSESMKKNAALNEAYSAGKTALDNKQYDVAIENFAKASELDPKQGAVWSGLAQAYEQFAKTKTGADLDTNMQKAAESWTKAIEINPEEAGLHNNYALVLAQCKKFPEAQAELEKAATLNPPGAGQYYYNLGALEVNSGQNDAASETFKKAIAIVPPFPEAFYQYGLTLLAKATLDKDGKTVPVPGTTEALQKYLELAPNGSHVEEAKAMLASLGTTLQTEYKNPDAGIKKKKSTTK